MNNVFSNNLYRIPVDAAGKPGQPVDIWMDQPVKGPDTIWIAERGTGKAVSIPMPK